MSGQLGEGIEIVAKMTAIRDDGAPVAVAWIRFVGEDVNDAEAFEVTKDGRGLVRLVPLALGKLADWRRVAAMTAEGG